MTVKISNLWFKYEQQWILREVNLEVYDGEIVVIYGENGSGKSTLLKLIAGYLQPTRGIIERKGKAIYVPQLPYLFFTEETIGEELRKICLTNQRDEQCINKGQEILLSHQYDLESSPFSLSWGQQVKLAVLLALLTESFTLALLDETFSGLSYMRRIELAQFLISVPGAKVVTASTIDSIYPFLNSRILVLKNTKLQSMVFPIEYNRGTKDNVVVYKASEAIYGDGRC